MKNHRNDIYYTASLLEFLARKTKNHRSVIAQTLGIQGIDSIYRYADVNHCLPFDQVADELIEAYHISEGTYYPEALFQVTDTIAPKHTQIGKAYANLVCDIQPVPEQYPAALYDILCSKISEWMTDYRSAFYYSPRDYILYRWELLQNAG